MNIQDHQRAAAAAAGHSELTRDVRLTHRTVGEPSYSTLARITGYSTSTIGRIMTGDGGKLSKWPPLEALLRALEVPDQLIRLEWRPRWVHVRNLMNPLTETAATNADGTKKTGEENVPENNEEPSTAGPRLRVVPLPSFAEQPRRRFG
jgi:hypothetical protein